MAAAACAGRDKRASGGFGVQSKVSSGDEPAGLGFHRTCCLYLSENINMLLINRAGRSYTPRQMSVANERFAKNNPERHSFYQPNISLAHR